MPTLVVGVGGTGRGVLAWLKKRLAEEWGSPTKAGFQLLLIDGPGEEEQQYRLPGGSPLDTSPGSAEFFGLTKRPAEAVVAIQKGKPYKYIGSWLTKPEATKITNPEATVPDKGYGGFRVAGRVGFFLEAAELAARLREAASEKDYVVVVGSLAGGTGAGQLLDVGQLLREYKPRLSHLVGVVVLPSCFRSVLTDARDQADSVARGFAGLRELERQMAASEHAPVRIQYADEVGVEGGRVFDVCLLVDGAASAAHDLSSDRPLYGVCPALADIVLNTFVPGIAADQMANWAQAHATVDGQPAYASAGIYNILFPAAEIIDAFARKFAVDLYDRMLSVPEAQAGRSDAVTSRVLSSSGIGDLAVTLGKEGALPIEPPIPHRNEAGLEQLLNKCVAKVPDELRPPWPPFLRLTNTDIVPIDWIFRRVDNEEVPPNCERWTNRYLGSPTDEWAPQRQTLWGWANHQSRRISFKFAQELGNEVQNLFWNETNKEWRPLSQEPFAIVVTKEVIELVRGRLAGLAEYSAQLRSEVVAERKLIEQQRAAVDNARRRLLSRPRRNGNEQRRYVNEHQQLLELLAWEVLVQATEQIAKDMHRLTNRLWQMVGAHAEGWVDYFSNVCRAEMQQQLDQSNTNRQLVAQQVRSRCYVPAPSSPAEMQLYARFVHEGNLVDELLSRMKWRLFSKHQRSPLQTFNPALTPQQVADSYELYLEAPEQPGFKRETYAARRYDVQTGEYRKLVIGQHVPEEVAHFARTSIQEGISELTVWDALAYEFRYNLGEGERAEAFAREKFSDLSEKSGFMLALAPAARGAQEAAERYLITARTLEAEGAPARDIGTIASAIATAINDSLQAAGGAIQPVDDPDFSHSLALMAYGFKLNLSDWAGYGSSRQTYYRRRPSLPIHCWLEESNAADKTERYLLRQKRASPDELPLDATVVRYLGDWEAFQIFALAYLVGLIDEEGETDAEREFLISWTDSTGETVTTQLGRAANMNGVLAAYMAPENAEARRALRQAWGRFLGGKKRAKQWPDNVRRLVVPVSPDSVDLPEEHADHPEGLNRKHLQWALWAAARLWAADNLPASKPKKRRKRTKG